MLQKLSIQNFALIHELEINFSNGLTIITGETGAGKSILLGALSLLLGNRADSGTVADKKKKCIVEGEFETTGYQLESFFKDNDLDCDAKTLIRREVNADGKSRAFVNDTPVNLSVLKDLGSRLIEIHSQHETLTLNNSVFQMMVLDNFADSGKLLSKYTKEYHHYISLTEKLQELKETESKSKADLDYFQFLFNEIDEIQLTDGEQEQLESELSLINNSEEIKNAIVFALNKLGNNDTNVINELSSIASTLDGVINVFPGVDEHLKRLKSLLIEAKDIHSEIESLEGDVIYHPERAEIINDRLAVIYKLQQKHRVDSIGELIQIKNDLEQKLETISTLETEIVKVAGDVEVAKSGLIELANAIRDLRKKAIPGIQKSVHSVLESLGMKHSVLKINLDSVPEGEFRINGCDQVKFMFSANKGVEYRELNKVASGGELSRLMLTIKSLIAKRTGLPTIIFDEIDTGVSGEIAHKVGNIVKEISKERQVIAITHLPQMAGKGDDHLFVYKESKSNSTTTGIKKLKLAERIEEIAKMLSGEQPTKAALTNAKELLSTN